MTPLAWITGGLLFMGVVLFALALCRAAARGDRMAERAREMAGPDDRERLGL